ncbi:MAG: mechanosensitive ion channel family protein [Solirubrobacteraceae bacterium]|jgi:small-conductance mechanosensitive channel
MSDERDPARQPGAAAPVVDRWRDLSRPIELSRWAIRRARLESLVLAALFAAVILVYDYRHSLLGIRPHPPGHPHMSATANTVAQAITVIALVILGWGLARNFGRSLGPVLERRVDAATAGTVGFLVRLATLLAAVVVALRIAGVNTTTLAIGASFTAVVFGLAAQQTFGNLIAGMVLLSARPFRVGERVRLQGGAIGGRIEGTASTLGLLYTTFSSGERHVMVPNSVVLSVSITPLLEPDAVSLRVRLPPGTTPLELRRVLEDGLVVRLRSRPSITLEEIDGSEVIVQISATPADPSDSGKLAGELLALVSSRIGETTQRRTT